MRFKLLSGCIATACLIGMPIAYGQGTEVNTGNHGADTTCSEFMALTEAAQSELLDQIQNANDTSAMATDDAAGSDAAAPSDNADDAMAAGDASDSESASQDDSTAQAVMAACADGKLTVGQALEQSTTAP